jgi:biopolymer transport protein ExbD
MGMSSGGQRGKVHADINVTPLIDVCLVMLIIFMVVTPMLQKGAPVALPQTDNPDKKAEQPNQVLISVDRDKNLWIDTDRYPEDAFKAEMKDRKERNAGLEVLLKGDRTLTYGDVLKLMRICNEVEITGVSLVTEKIKKKGEG